MTDFNIDDLPAQVSQRLSERRITTPTPIQAAVIPELLSGTSVFFQSETGTGKTLAFLIPIIIKIFRNPPEQMHPQVIILSPTSELASQIKGQIQMLESALPYSRLKSILCIGGTSIKRQIENLKTKPSVVVGTPVRVSELIRLKKIKLRQLHTVVLDEADRLLAGEFSQPGEDFFSHMPNNVQYTACSATFSETAAAALKQIIEKYAKTVFSEYRYIRSSSEQILQKNIAHWALFSDRRKKIDTLRSFIRAVEPAKILIFTAPASDVENIVTKLQFKKIACAGLYSKNDGMNRKNTVQNFRSGKVPILVTSDLSSRGLDIPDVDFTVQMNIPSRDSSFIHRAGRTGRAARKGVNLVIGDEFELRKLRQIEQRLALTVYPKELYRGRIQSP